MKLSQFKMMAAIGALVLGLGIVPAVKAADNATITTSITTLGVLDVQTVQGTLNFGTWYIDNPTGDTSTLVKSSSTGVVTPTADTNSTLSEAVANTTRAQLTVAITGGGGAQDGTVVQVRRSAPSAFSDGDLALTDVTYETANETSASMTVNQDYPVTIAAGASPEPVYFGGELTASDTIDPNTTLTSTFTVTFSY